MNPRNKHWRRQKLVQKYITRLKKFPASTPCSCWLCKGERYNRRKFKEETKLEIEMF